MLRSSLPGIGLSAAVVAVSLAIYGATQDGGRGPAPTAAGGASADVTLPRPLAASGPFGPQPVAGGPGGGDEGRAPIGGVVFVPVVFDPPATLPATPQPLGGGRRRDGGNRPDRRPGKRGNQRGTPRHGGNERGETVRPTARPATPAPQQPAQPGRPAPQRPDPPRRPVDPPVKAGNPRAPGLLKQPGRLPPGQAKKQAAPAPAPVAAAPVAPAPKPSRPAKPAKPVVPPGQAKQQAPAPAAPPAAAPAPAAPPASGCAPAGNGQGKANGRC